MGWIIGLLVVALAIEFLFARSLWRSRNEAEDAARKARRDAFDANCLREGLARQNDALGHDCDMAKEAQKIFERANQELQEQVATLKEQVATLKARVNKKRLPAKPKASKPKAQ